MLPLDIVVEFFYEKVAAVEVEYRPSEKRQQARQEEDWKWNKWRF